MIKEVKNDKERVLSLDELDQVTGGTIMQTQDVYGRPVYNVYNDRTNQLVGSFYNLYEAVNCNLRVNG